MTKRRISSLLSIVAISALAIGCGGSSSATVKTTEVTGTVIDDYISGATVCADVNNNGEVDVGDTPCVTTNALGQFTFPSTTDVAGSPLVMAGGTDVGTGEDFTGTLTAPAGSTVVNPLTTIIQAVVKAGNSVAEAETIVQTSLGLPDLDLLSYDPIAALASDDAAEVEAAKEVFTQQSVIQTILTTVAATIAATVSGTGEEDVTHVVADQIATVILATPTVEVDISDDAQIETIIEEAATEANTTVDTALIVAVADQVDATTTQIVISVEESNTTDIAEIREVAAQIATVSQENTSTTVTSLENNETIADIVGAVVVASNAETLEAAVAAVDINTTALETVATEESAPADDNSTLTGAEGAN